MLHKMYLLLAIKLLHPTKEDYTLHMLNHSMYFPFSYRSSSLDIF